MTAEEKLDAVLGELRALKELLRGSQKEALSLSEAAQRLSLSKDTLARHIRNGQLTPFRVGRRVLVPTSEVDRLVSVGGSSRTPSPKPRVRRSAAAAKIRGLAGR